MQINIYIPIKKLLNFLLSLLFVVLFASGLSINQAFANANFNTFTYVVKKGDSLSTISKKFGLRVKSIKTLNKLESNNILAGQRLKIKLSTNNKPRSYRVRRGDSLFTIAKKFKTSIRSLMRINKLKSSKIRIGQKLYLTSLPKASDTYSNSNVYRVKRGDSLSLIAKKFKTSVRGLKRINGLKNSRIRIGQKIFIRPIRKVDNRPPSVGTQLGLRKTKSKIRLNSSAVLVINQISGEIMLEKNPDAILPIASITKLMTALVIIEKNMSLLDMIRITKADAKLERYNKSRLTVGSKFSRGDLLHLALMSSENRAAHALARTYPGGVQGFVRAMNAKAKLLGMWSTVFTEPTGLNSGNVSSPRDLIRLVDEASRLPLVREYSTSVKHLVRIRNRTHKFRNSNALARGELWDLGVSKTGFIRDAGRCLVMQAFINKSPVIIVMLDAEGNSKRRRDAEQIKNWILNAKTEKKYFKKTNTNIFQTIDIPEAFANVSID